MRSKLFWMRKRNTAKNTSMNTTPLTPGMLALPSMRCETLMSWTVNTNDSTPHPMGGSATTEALLAKTMWALAQAANPDGVVDREKLAELFVSC